MIENDPSSRMQVLSRGELLPPGTCYVCGNGTCDDGYVDFGTFVDYHGNLYFCMICAKQLADTIGYLSPETMALANKALENKVKELETTEKELADARKHVDSVNALFASRYTPTSGDLPDSDPGERVQKPSVRGKGGESETEESSPFARPKYPNGPKSRNLTFSGDGE